VNKFLRSLLKAGIYLLEQSDQTTADIRDRVKAQVEDLTDRAGQAIRGQEDHTVRNAISFAAGTALGLAVAILFAPASGEQTRSELAGKVRNVGNRVREQLSPDEQKPATGTEG
jgi:regulation of enolase protein 1 (concanavalin A-like superfamily)